LVDVFSNPILNYDQSLLIFSHVANSVRFVRARRQAEAATDAGVSRSYERGLNSTGMTWAEGERLESLEKTHVWQH